MPSWRKIIVSGSDASLNSLNAPSITGSLSGTASFATSASNAIYAETASISNATTLTQLLVINQTGATINKGVVVRISGSNNASDIPRIATASYETDGVSANTLGIVSANITNGSQGYVITEGVLTGLNTTGWSSGTLLFLGATGSITASAPQAPLHAVRLGQVIREQNNNGSIHIRVDNGYELGELHDVTDTTTTASFGDLLVKSGSVWINSRQLTGSYAVTGSLIISASGTTNDLRVGTNKLFVSASGNVGIGTTTPSAKLEVNGDFKFGPWGGGVLTFGTYQYGTDFDMSPIIGPGGWARAHRIKTSDPSGSIFFGAHGTGTGLTKAFWTIDTSGSTTFFSTTKGIHLSSSGNVGIGITSPSASLHVNNTGAGNSFLVEDSTNPDATPFLIDASGNTMIGTTSSYGPLTVRGTGATGVTMDTDSNPVNEFQSTRLFFKISGSGLDTSIRNFSGSLVFSTRATSNNSSGTSAVVISGSGDVGIGSNFSPSAARGAILQASGNISIESGYAYKQDSQNVIYIDKGTDTFYANTIGGPSAGTIGSQRQTVFGANAGRQQSGSFQTAVGYNAGYLNSGSDQTVIGALAGQLNTGSFQTAIGSQAGYQNSGNNQTAVGYQAGSLNVSRDQTAIGIFAGVRNSGSAQTAVGYGAGVNNSGSSVTQVGYAAGQYNIGNNQTAIGLQAGYLNTGSDQTAVGYYAGAYNSGSDNTNIGYAAGYYIAGTSGTINSQSAQSVFLGSQTTAGGGNRTNQIVIGYNASGIGDNSVVLGNSSIQTTALRGFVGIGTTTPTASLHVNNTTTSASFLVEDSTNPDTTPFIINNAGDVGIGTITPSASLHVMGNTLITGSLTVGSSSIGPSENTLTLGARDAVNEGAQIGFNAPGGTYTSASMIDNYQNRFRILRGTNSSSDAEFFNLNLHSGQVTFNKYTGSGAFSGTAAGYLAFDSLGNIITTAGVGASAAGSDTQVQFNNAGTTAGTAALRIISSSVQMSGSVGVTGSLIISASGAINDLQVGTDKLFVSASGNIGIGITTPSAKLHVNNTTTGNSLLVEDFANPDATPFVIDATGNVGIGTTAPQYLFVASSSTSTDTVMFFDGGASANSNLVAAANTSIKTPILVLSDRTNSYTPATSYFLGLDRSSSPNYASRNDAIYVNNYQDKGHYFVTNDGGSKAVRMVISGSGNVGIGTTLPNSASLHVNGNVFATSFTGSLQGTASYSPNIANSNLTITNDETRVLSHSGTSRFIISGSTTSHLLELTNTTIGNSRALRIQEQLNGESNRAAVRAITAAGNNADSSQHSRWMSDHIAEVVSGSAVAIDKLRGWKWSYYTEDPLPVYKDILIISTSNEAILNASLTVSGSHRLIGNLIITGSTSTDLVRITQTGTGNAFVVEDDTNPDATPFTINNSGNVGVGVTPNTSFGVYSQAGSVAAIRGVAGDGVHGIGVGDFGTIRGVLGAATAFDTGDFGTTYIGGDFSASTIFGSTYAVRLQDGSEAAGKVLVSQTSDGKARWGTTLTGAYTVNGSLQVSSSLAVTGSVTVSGSYNSPAGNTIDSNAMIQASLLYLSNNF